MASLVTSVVDGYYDLIENQSDQRVKDWFMMSSPFPTICISLFYVYFAKVLGPKLMENRKPFELRNTLLVYNLVQVFVSVYLFYEAIACGWLTTYSLLCQPVDFSYSPMAMRMASGCHLYYISKLSELADTVFFVLRKKNNQITNLHVIHHGIMPVSVWFGVKFIPGGHSTFFGLLNTFVHIWMYLYYFLAAFGPEVRRYLWWKKYLTSLQIAQFLLVLMHDLPLLFIECNHSRFFIVWVSAHALLFMVMFSDFYRKAYMTNSKSKREFDVGSLEVDPDREGIKQSDLWAKNYDHLKRKNKKSSEFDVRKLEVDPEREGIKQSDLWAKNYEHLAKKLSPNGTSEQENPSKPGSKSDDGLRNRVIIDKNSNVDA